MTYNVFLGQSLWLKEIRAYNCIFCKLAFSAIWVYAVLATNCVMDTASVLENECFTTTTRGVESRNLTFGQLLPSVELEPSCCTHLFYILFITLVGLFMYP